MLPRPDGPLSKVVPASTISAANKKEKSVLAVPAAKPGTCTHGPYDHFTPEEKAWIGKTAAEHGVTATIRYFSKVYPLLKESSVRTWKKKKSPERKACEDMTVKQLVNKKRGHPLLLGCTLYQQVRAYLTALRNNGAVVNTAIAIGCAEGVVKNFNSNLLECNGGHIKLTKSWAKCLMLRMGFAKWRASTNAKVSVADFKFYKTQFILMLEPLSRWMIYQES